MWSAHAGCAAAIVASVLVCGGAAPAPRNPEIKDHEIARFVALKTSCGLRDIARLNPGGRPLLFHVGCNNAASWPAGMDIACHEPDDDRSCRVTTKEQIFKSLDLLRRRD